MKWILLASVVLVALVVAIAAVGAMLPRDHVASRSLTVPQPPEVVWPALLRAMQGSSVPVDILEQHPPRRLVTRVSEKETNFGGTWTIAIAPTSAGSTVSVTEQGWVANPIFRFVSRFVMGHHATLDAILKQVASDLGVPAALSGA